VKRYRVEYLPEARAAISETFRFILKQDGSGNAERWLRAFTAGVDKLETEAPIHPVSAVRSGQELRSKLVESHRVYD